MLWLNSCTTQKVRCAFSSFKDSTKSRLWCVFFFQCLLNMQESRGKKNLLYTHQLPPPYVMRAVHKPGYSSSEKRFNICTSCKAGNYVSQKTLTGKKLIIRMLTRLMWQGRVEIGNPVKASRGQWVYPECINKDLHFKSPIFYPF